MIGMTDWNARARELIQRITGWRDEQPAHNEAIGILAAALAQAAREGRAQAFEEAAIKVRHDCPACSGTGQCGPDECEYCGRPIDAIRALAKGDGK